MPMEEQGGDGTAFSHWDARVMHTEAWWIWKSWGDWGSHGVIWVLLTDFDSVDDADAT